MENEELIPETFEPGYPKITEIMKITGTAEGNGVYELEIKVQYKSDGEPQQETYISRPDDPYGVNPTIRLWMNQNPDAPVHVYMPPAPLTQEERRERMPNLTARQFRLGLVANGISPSQIDFVISQMPNGPDKDTAEIEWGYATTFKRTHPLIGTLSASLGLTPESVDTMWTNAINL